MFSADLIRVLGAPAEEVHRALWELVAAGLVNADGFDSLRVLIDPRRKRAFAGPGKAKSTGRHASGRWALLVDPGEPLQFGESKPNAARRPHRLRRGAMRRSSRRARCCCGATASSCAMCWRARRRWRRGGSWWECSGGWRRAAWCVAGDLFRDLAESSLRCRRLPMRCGRIAMRTLADMPPLTMAAADPMNLVGIVIPGERTASIAGNTVTLPLPPTEAEAVVVEMPVARGFAFDVPLPPHQPKDRVGGGRGPLEGGAIA
jgi:ATP-dependent helicase Lhr and Lhr-like helicase